MDCLDLKIEIKLPSLNLFRKNMLTTMVYFFLSMKRMQGGFEHQFTSKITGKKCDSLMLTIKINIRNEKSV